jgi:hypothetical protein
VPRTVDAVTKIPILQASQALRAITLVAYANCLPAPYLALPVARAVDRLTPVHERLEGGLAGRQNRRQQYAQQRQKPRSQLPICFHIHTVPTAPGNGSGHFCFEVQEAFDHWPAEGGGLDVGEVDPDFGEGEAYL